MNRKQFARVAKLISITAFILWAFLPAVQASDPEFKISLSSSKIQMGETSTLQITAQWPEGPDSFSFMTPQPELENLKIVRSGESQETTVKEGSEWEIKTFEIELAPEKVGQGIIRAFTLNYLKRSENSAANSPPPSDFYRIPEFKIKITSAPSLQTLLISIVCVGLSIFIGSFYLLNQSRKRTPRARTTASDEDKTIQDIQILLSALTESELKDTAFKVAILFRDFLIRHFQLKWKAYSELELIESLKQKGAEDPDLFRLLTRLHDTKYATGRVDRLALRQLGEDMVVTIQGKKVVDRPNLSS